MPGASSRRNAPSLLAIILAGAACGQELGPSVSGEAATAASGTGSWAFGGSLDNSSGGAITPTGGAAGSAAASGDLVDSTDPAVGFGKYQNTGAFLVYIDEVAFDGERIGCNN